MSKRDSGAPVTSQWFSPLRQTGARRRMAARTGPQPRHEDELSEGVSRSARRSPCPSEHTDLDGAPTVRGANSALYGYETRPTIPVPSADEAPAAEASQLGPESIAHSEPRPLPEPPRATLVYETGAEAGRLLCLEEGERLLGRGMEANGHFTEGTVSRRHARVHRAGQSYVVTDLGSRNGTFVDDQRVSSRHLQPGDTVRLGPFETLRFCLLDTTQRELLANLHERQCRDELTGAHNRQHFLRCLETAVAGARGWNMALSVFLVDVRRFSALALHHGQQTAEQLLCDVAATIQRAVPRNAVVCRFVEDKFAIMVHGEAQLRNGRLAALIASSIRSEVGVTSPRVSMRVSIGWTSLRAGDHGSAVELLRAADERLCQAKQATGSHCVGDPHE